MKRYSEITLDTGMPEEEPEETEEIEEIEEIEMSPGRRRPCRAGR